MKTGFRISIGLLLFLYSTGVQAENACPGLEEAVQMASELRGLKVLEPVKCLVLSNNDFQSRIEKLYRKEQTEELTRLEEIINKMLGFIPEDYPYTKCLYGQTAMFVLAFYDRERKALTFRKGVEASKEIVVHEAVHALQDQHFGLEKLNTVRKASTDMALAIGALVEGDATVVEETFIASEKKRAQFSDFGKKEKEKEESENRCALPQSLLLQYGFVYDYGALFIRKLKMEHGALAIDKAFRVLPRTTKEIMLPKLYPLAEKPVITTAPLPSFLRSVKLKLLHTEHLGQFTIQTLLKGFVKKEEAILAAKGWRGDTLSFYERGKSRHHLMHWTTHWESEGDTEQFAKALRALIQKRYSLALAPSARSFGELSSGEKVHLGVDPLVVSLVISSD